MLRFVRCFVASVLLAYSVSSQGLLGAPSTDTKLDLRMNYFKMCPDHMDVPSAYESLTLEMDPDEEDILFVNGVLNMKENIPVGSIMQVDVRKCYNEKENSCEKYLVHNVPDACDYMNKKDSSWAKFFSHMKDMIPKCPVPAGSYEMVDAPVDIGFLNNYTLIEGHWESELSLVGPDDKRYGCVLLDMTFTRRRRSRR